MNKKVALYFCLTLTLTWSHANGQFYYFGQNKVQYTKFNWQILRTEHFDVYYYPEMTELARQGAALAENGYRYLEEKFDMNVGNRIPLIFYSSHLFFEQTNTTPGFIPEGVGGFFEFLKGRVVIPFDGSLAEFRHVIRHELVHVFMNAKITRVLRDHRQSTDREPPLWFSEGLAEFWSTNWDNQAEMVMRDAVLNNYIVPLSQMEKIYGTFLMYKEGQNILQFISEKYGDDKILLLMENFWKSKSFQDVFKLTIGMNYKEFDRVWIYNLEKKYYPLLSKEDMPSRVTTNVYSYGFNSAPVYYKTRSGIKLVLYIGNHNGYTNIYMQRISDHEEMKPQVVIKGEQTREFESFHVLSTGMSVSSKGILAFSTKSGETDEIHFFDIEKNKIAGEKRFNEIVNINSISFSPDANKLVFSGAGKSGFNNLYIYDIKSNSLYQLTSGYYDDLYPSWSPNGTWIVFSSNRASQGYHGAFNLFLFDLKSGKIYQLTEGTHIDTMPIWSPSGNAIAYVSNIDGAENIYVARFKGVDSLECREISHFITAAANPAWIDSSQIVFSAFENYSFQIRIIDSVSTKLRNENRVLAFKLTPLNKSWTPESYDSTKAEKTVPYTPQFTIDIAQSQISTDPIFGTSGGAAMALSDMLGNEQYYFLVYNTAQTQDDFFKSFNVAVSRISLAERTNHAYGIFNFSGRRYDLTDPDVYFYERLFGGYFSLSYPLSRFKRIEGTVSLANSYKANYYGIGERTAMLLSNSVAYIEDNSLWGPTGPIDGHRLMFSLAYTTDIQYSLVNYFTIMLDTRWYFRLSRTSAFATREALFLNEGQEARRFFMGGSWDLRGWNRWSLIGKKLWLASQELRFPLIEEINLVFPFGSMTFPSIRGAIFFDAGAVWDERYTQTIGDIGFGIRFNLFGALVLRYDIGKKIEDNFGRFQKKLFYQFFFGWDF